MTSEARIVRSDRDELHHSQSKDSVVRELEKHGYVADPYSTEPNGGALFRHAAAPSLIVHDDGRIELPAGQRPSHPLVPVRPPSNRIRWTRTLIFFALLCGTIFLGLIVTALIVG